MPRLSRERLILDHLWIIRYWSTRLDGSADDLHSIGYFALVNAAKTWRSGDFRKYATRAVHRSMSRPYNTHNGKHQYVPRAIPRDQGSEASLEEIPAVSSNQMLTADEAVTFLAQLPAQERQAVKLSFGIGRRKRLSSQQIGERMGLSKRAADNLIRAGLLRLRWLAVQREREESLYC